MVESAFPAVATNAERFAENLASQTIQTRIGWLRESGMFNVLLVGPEGEQDCLAKKMYGSDLLEVRPDVIHNHLAIFHALDSAMGNPIVSPPPRPFIRKSKFCTLRKVFTYVILYFCIVRQISTKSL